MNKYLHRRHIAGIALVMAALANVAAFGQAPPSGPGVIFQNTTATPLDVYRVSADGAEERVIEQLAPGAESKPQSTQEGDKWFIKVRDSSQDAPLAEYTANASADQVVDLANLIAWQLPVELVIQNNTEAPVDVVWIGEAGDEQTTAEALPPGNQATTTTYPGGTWRLKEGDQIVAEFSAGIEAVQVLDVAGLKAAYAGAVVLHFQNTTTDPVDVYWVHPDGHEVEYALGVPPGKQFDQRGHPGHLWSVRNAGGIVAYYRADDRAEQEVDLKVLGEATRKVLADLIAASGDAASGDGLWQVITKPGQPPMLAVRGANDSEVQAAATLAPFLPPPERPKRSGRNTSADGIVYAPLAGASAGQKLVDVSKLTAASGNSSDTGTATAKPGLPKPKTNLPKPKPRTGNSN
jgi:hypothetical protein